MSSIFFRGAKNNIGLIRNPFLAYFPMRAALAQEISTALPPSHSLTTTRLTNARVKDMVMPETLPFDDHSRKWSSDTPFIAVTVRNTDSRRARTLQVSSASFRLTKLNIRVVSCKDPTFLRFTYQHVVRCLPSSNHTAAS